MDNPGRAGRWCQDDVAPAFGEEEDEDDDDEDDDAADDDDEEEDDDEVDGAAAPVEAGDADSVFAGVVVDEASAGASFDLSAPPSLPERESLR